MRTPKIYRLPLSRLGTHETIVVVIDGEAHSFDTWNYSESESGNRTFMTDNVKVQLFFPVDSVVSVIRT